MKDLIEQDAQAHAHRGETYRLKGDFEQALAAFQEALKRNSHYAWAYAHRGETYRLMENYDEALKDFDRAIELDKNYAWAYAHRGATHRLMKRYAEALADLNRAIELQPDYAWAIAYRCQIYGLTRRYAEALADFDKSITLDETIIPHWRSERGLLASYCGRYAEAIECCEQELKVNPHDWRALYALAVAQARWKGVAEAAAEIVRARMALLVAVNTVARGAVLYRLGGLMALEGYIEQALGYLQEAIPLEPEAVDLANHDLAWLTMRADPRFQGLIAENIAVSNLPSLSN